jgi:hypothetical protein
MSDTGETGATWIEVAKLLPRLLWFLLVAVIVWRLWPDIKKLIP